MILILHIVGFFAVFISLVTFSAGGDAAQVFHEFRNTGGWSSQGLSWCVGLLGSVYSFVGKCSTQLSDDTYLENSS